MFLYHFYYTIFPLCFNQKFMRFLCAIVTHKTHTSNRRTGVKQILCLSNQPWSTSPGRTQQLISRLRDTQILYFCPASGRTDRAWT